jgi:hypothetical protein
MTALGELPDKELEFRLAEVRRSIAFVEQVQVSSLSFRERESTIDKLRWHETDLVLAIQNRREAAAEAVRNSQTPLSIVPDTAHE